MEQERAQAQLIKSSGGARDDCKRSKKKVSVRVAP